MKKLAATCGLLLLLGASAMAQDAADAPQDSSAPAPAPRKQHKKERREISRYELFGGFAYRSNYQTNYQGVASAPYYSGWVGSFDRNFLRLLGVEGELSGVYKNQGVITGNAAVYTFLAGPRFYPLGHRKFTPFIHVLAGIGMQRLTTGPFGGFSQTTTTNTVKAWEGGGGLDWFLSPHWAIRVIEFDFGGANFVGGNSTQGPKRYSAGVVYHFGKK